MSIPRVLHTPAVAGRWNPVLSTSYPVVGTCVYTPVGGRNSLAASLMWFLHLHGPRLLLTAGIGVRLGNHGRRPWRALRAGTYCVEDPVSQRKTARPDSPGTHSVGELGSVVVMPPGHLDPLVLALGLH